MSQLICETAIVRLVKHKVAQLDEEILRKKGFLERMSKEVRSCQIVIENLDKEKRDLESFLEQQPENT